MIILPCPHCSSDLGVNPIEEHKVLSNCPRCGKHVLVVNEGGLYSMRKPNEYKCKKCGRDFIYDGRPPMIYCEQCGELYVTSQHGDYLLEQTVFEKGENGGFNYHKKEDKLIKAINAWKQKPKSVKAGVYAAAVCIIAVLIGLYILSLPTDILSTQAYAASPEFIKEFREKNPYNVQVAALKRYDDGSYNILLSEPSEDVSEKDLEKLFKKYNSKLKTYQTPIGFDGWIKDAVVSFNDIKDSDFPKLTSELFKLLYSTDYKAELLDFSEVPAFTAYSQSDLNMQVTEEELRSWLLEGDEKFAQAGKSDYESLDLLMSAGIPGIYYSKEPGFVVWLLNGGANLSDVFKVKSRIFSLDSDLILGAIKKNRMVAIVGREREESLWDLPPMRSETLSILASTNEDELMQSYERARLLAGKMIGADGGKDWAPILLSDALWHTEYGNILNVTDQMLKSWSENGDIEYENFNYQKPVYWAFNVGATKDLGVTTLTYNWNTEGVGYVVDDGDCEIYALNRTGSLPVSYIPGESEGISSNDPVYQAEELAYDFFSSLSNTSLVRVVQYAAMYQIFKNLGVSLSDIVDVDEGTPVATQEMYDAVSGLVENVKDYKRESYASPLVNNIAKMYGVPLTVKDYDKFDEYFKRIQNAETIEDYWECKKYFNTLPDTIFACYYRVYETLNRIDSLSMALSPVSGDDAFMSSFSRYLADGNGGNIKYQTETSPRYNIPTPSFYIDDNGELKFDSQTQKSKTKEEKVDFAISEFSKYSMDSGLNQFFAHVNPKVRTSYYRDQYCNENKGRSRQWMKCPTVVQSWQSRDSVFAEGGHNLNSKVTSFKVNKNLKPGQVQETIVNGRKIYEVAPADLRNGVTSQSYLRRLGRLGDTSLNGAKSTVRARNGVVSSMARAERGASRKHIKVNATEKGFELDGKQMSWSDLLDEVALRISEGKEKMPFIEIETTNFNKAGVDLQAMIDGVVYKMPRGEGFRMPLSKFDMANYTTEIQGDRAIVKIPIKAGKIEFGNPRSAKASLNGKAVQTDLLIKEGSVTFNVPKNRLQEFLSVIMEYFRDTNAKWNQFHLQRKMRQRGINPADIIESNHLRVAKQNINFKFGKDAWVVQEEKIA